MFVTLIGMTLQAASPAAGVQAVTADDGKPVCRRQSETGSLVRRTKTCRTKAEWRRIEQGAQETGRGMQSQLAVQSGG